MARPLNSSSPAPRAAPTTASRSRETRSRAATLTCASSENRPRLIAKLLPVIRLGLLLAGPLPARADGAFPDEMSIHFPASAPHRILLTNFGLAVSEDDGATWRYSCEPY